MPSINLDILTNVNAGRNNANVFTDISLDLAIGSTTSDQLYKTQQILDIRADTNLGAIYNSISNIITTNPGQKPLNPVFGIGFGDMLFLPVSDSRAQAIGEAIFQGITTYEPRVKVLNINIFPDSENQQYTVTLSISVPRFSSQQVTIVGVLDKSGFYFN